MRFRAEEFVPEGLHLEEAARIAERLVAEVQTDFIHVTHSAYRMNKSLGTQMADMGVDKTMFRRLPGAIRAATRKAPKPVAIFTVCQYRDLEEAEAMIAAGDADMVGSPAPHRGPGDVVKTQSGRAHEIRRCIGCNQGCAQNLEKNLALTCMVNPRAGGRPCGPRPKASRRARKECAGGGRRSGRNGSSRDCRARGHRVRLWERGARLGGRLALAAGLRKREDFGLWLDYASRRLQRLGVEVELGRDAPWRPSWARSRRRCCSPPVPSPRCIACRMARRFLSLDEAAQGNFSGRHVAVYDETGDWGAYGLVEHLAEDGARVTLITPSGGFMWRTTVYSNLTGFARWREKRIKVMTLRRPHASSTAR